MSSKYLTLDEKLCENCRSLSRFNPSGIMFGIQFECYYLLRHLDYALILSSAINVLDGSITLENMDTISTQCNIGRNEVETLVKSSGGLIWDFVKSNSINSMTPVLLQVGFDASLAEAFGKVSSI